MIVTVRLARVENPQEWTRTEWQSLVDGFVIADATNLTPKLGRKRGGGMSEHLRIGGCCCQEITQDVTHWFCPTHGNCTRGITPHMGFPTDAMKDGIIHSLEAKVKELKDALRPFANMSECIENDKDFHIDGDCWIKAKEVLSGK